MYCSIKVTAAYLCVLFCLTLIAILVEIFGPQDVRKTSCGYKEAAGAIFASVVITNVVTGLVYFMDKRAAVSGAWRTPERVLLLLNFFGGSIGALVGMCVCRHKTSKSEFYLPAYILAVLNLTWVLLGIAIWLLTLACS